MNKMDDKDKEHRTNDTYIDLETNDKITKGNGKPYTVIKLLGVGTYSTVYKCYQADLCSDKNTLYALKIIKSGNKFLKFGYEEAKLMEYFAKNNLTEYFPVYYDGFTFKNHYVIVSELLGNNLYEVLKSINHVGIEHKILKPIITQILKGLDLLHSIGFIHCDLKPENIVIKDIKNVKIKIIDFGNVVYGRGNKKPLYVQSRYYRAPEVIFGLEYNYGIDVWSLGCIIFELYTGKVLFPGKTNNEMVERFLYMLGRPPRFMIELGQFAVFLNERCSEIVSGKGQTNTKHYKKLKSTDYPDFFDFRSEIMNTRNKTEESGLLFNFLQQLLNYNYLQRPTTYHCLKHDYLTKRLSIDACDLNSENLKTANRNIDNRAQEKEEPLRRQSMADVENIDLNVATLTPRKYSVYTLPEDLQKPKNKEK